MFKSHGGLKKGLISLTQNLLNPSSLSNSSTLPSLLTNSSLVPWLLLNPSLVSSFSHFDNIPQYRLVSYYLTRNLQPKISFSLLFLPPSSCPLGQEFVCSSTLTLLVKLGLQLPQLQLYFLGLSKILAPTKLRIIQTLLPAPKSCRRNWSFAWEPSKTSLSSKFSFLIGHEMLKIIPHITIPFLHF